MKEINPFFITIFLIVSVSCTNQNHEQRIQKLEAQVSKLDSILKVSDAQKSVKAKNERTNAEENITSNSSGNQKFIGTWKYYKSIPAANDNSMNGIVCILERYGNTHKTFVFHLWTGDDLILSIKNENTLVGQNANLAVQYDASTDHLSLVYADGSKEVYSRLQ